MLPQDIELLTLAQVNINEDIPEDYPTLEGNALQKARYIFEKYGYSCFADDTGLEVAALDNEPGVYSARYAGEQKSSEDNIDKVLAKLGDSSNRKACFRTVIALILDAPRHRRLRIRPHLQARRLHRELRRDVARRQERHQPSRPRCCQAGSILKQPIKTWADGAQGKRNHTARHSL